MTRSAAYLVSIVVVLVTMGSLATSYAFQSEATGILPYAGTEWRTVHASPTNDDYVPIEIGRGFEFEWNALEGAATPAAPVVGPEGHIYQATGLGPGHSNLTALDQEGNILWQSEPWQDATGLDSCAIIQAPIVDSEGDLYLADCNQLWAFHHDGTVKWVTDLPAAPAGAPFQDGIPRNPPLTAFFMNDNAVGVATYFGQVEVWDREDGAPLADVVELPGGPGAFPIPAPAGAFAGVADPGVVDIVFNVAYGVYGEVVDTPAVSPESGRVFVLGSGSAPGTTSIYGVDLIAAAQSSPGQLQIAFETVVGAGGGASPAISPDWSTVYTTDATGLLTGLDTQTGEIVLSAQTTNTRPQSPSIGPDGRIYLGEGQAINPDGSVAWEADLSGLLASLVGDQVQILPFLNARIAGVITVTDNYLLFPVVVNITLDPTQFPFLPQAVDVPLKLVYVTADPLTGELTPTGTPYTAMENENSAFTVPLENGLVVANRGGFVVPLTAPLAPLANALVQSIAPGIDLEAQSASLGGIEAFRAVDEVTIVDATNGAVIVDGPLSSGDFIVNPNPAPGEPAISGTGTVGSTTVSAQVWVLPSGRNRGLIYVTNPTEGTDATIKVQDCAFFQGPSTAEGTADQGKYIERKKRNFAANWRIRDWRAP
jgi:hypothetical protein